MTLKAPLTALALIGLTGCLGPNYVGTRTFDPAQTSPSRQFGTATANNVAILSGEQGYRIALAQRFAQEAPSTVNFAFNSAALDAQARQALDIQANWIRQFPELRFRVYGHTDLVGSARANERLGMRRAQAVVAYLASRGIGRDRLEGVISRGKTQPLIVTQGRERRNRRTVTEVIGFVRAGRPTTMDGEYAALIHREFVASAASAPRVSGGGAFGGGISSGGGG